MILPMHPYIYSTKRTCMKKLYTIFALTCISAAAIAQNWSMGLQIASVSNKSRYTGGMSEANGRFHHNPYGGGSFNVLFRYKVNDHWSFQTGLGFTGLGFNYAVANDYSLLGKDGQYLSNSASFCTSEIPAVAIYSFKPNCRNSRLFAGGGVRMVMNSDITTSRTHVAPDEASGMTNSPYLDQTMYASAFTSVGGNFMFGIEKMFKKGSMFQLAVIGNKGFMDVATSTVNYSADGKEYQHTFTNSGDYWGVAFTYYFKPFQCGKQ